MLGKAPTKNGEIGYIFIEITRNVFTCAMHKVK